jgi:ATP-dependent helicase HrpA
MNNISETTSKAPSSMQSQLATNLTITYPEQLPICEKKADIIALIHQHQVIILAGETGSGKTTQIGKMCLQAGRGIQGMIGHTQPRRIAAKTIANRIAEELQVGLGGEVGCQVRFQDQTSPSTRIKLMTDGILLSELHADRMLKRYDTLIIDEAHERSLNIDFILGFLKQLLPKRPDLKLIITSATIDVERFSQHFNQAPIIEVSGRTFPVDTVYLPPEEINPEDEGNMAANVVCAMQEIMALERDGQGYRQGDVLVFLPGEREIRETAIALRKSQIPHLEILPLYARLSQSEQQRIFAQSPLRRVVLATNVAETSITVPGIRYVIDTGLARISRYSYRSKVQRLPIEAISKASANQRQGRCGRTSPGICLRLYSQQSFNLRPQFTQAEILRTNLAQVILQMLNLNLPNIAGFPFLDKPDNRYIRDGFKLLEEIGAVTKQHKLTPLGRLLNQLPIDPRLGRMVIAANDLGCTKEVMLIVSGLSVQDPRERPGDKQQQATQAHARFIDPRSDFIAFINLWQYVEDLRQALSQNQWRKQLQKEFISVMKIREWRDIHHQLHLSVKQAGLTINQKPASTDSIHQAILAGLLSQISQKEENREYLGARGRHYQLFPGSGLFKKPPAWMMSAELVETSKLYARINAQIEPHWALTYAKHLLKFHYSEPAWSSKTGHVMAKRRTSLYGLTLIDNERVSYTSIDPCVCHPIFIRQALVQGGYEKIAKDAPLFWQHNQQVIAEIVSLEAKARRCDILVDDEAIYAFYAAKIPAQITNFDQFEQWRKKQEANQPEFLYFDKSSLMLHSANTITQTQFPDTLSVGNHCLPLTYHFEPGHINDGVTLHIPLALLNQLSEAPPEWLVPGLLQEKCVELLKSLPKAKRKQLVPIPQFVHEILSNAPDNNTSLYQFLGDALRQKGVIVSVEELKNLVLDDYYRMNFHIHDEHGELIAQGRHLPTLKETCQPHIQEMLSPPPEAAEVVCYTRWEFGSLNQQCIEKSGVSMIVYPAIIDLGDAVTVSLVDTPEKASTLSHQGIIRLLWFAQEKSIKYLHKALFQGNQLSLILASFGLGESFKADVIDHVLAYTFLQQNLPDNAEAFQQCIAKHETDLIGNAHQLEQLLTTIFKLKQQVQKQLKVRNSLANLASIQDIQQQLAGLFHAHLLKTPLTQLKHYPRYLKAILHRLDRLEKDKISLDEIQRFEAPLRKRLDDDFSQLDLYPEFVHYRWLLEEYRVSLFAQHLKTAETVSAKRLKEAWSKG